MIEQTESGSKPRLIGNFPSRSTHIMERRRNDWRYGCMIYQVFVDRFAPSTRLEAKRHLYAAPRRLREWNELPASGAYLDDERNREGELEFWGGDLLSLMDHLDHIQGLGIDLVYLNPIFEAFTNHKYDATNYFRVDPQYGDADDLKRLVQEIHGRGMRLMLDGVFNHIGRRSPLFQRALADPASPERDFFTFGEEHRNGYLGWRNVGNLPELNLENPEVRSILWESRDSVVQSYLLEYDIDGWRLDVAPDVGFRYLRELTDAAHSAKADCSVIGECWNYPEEWLDVLDGIMNLHVGNLIIELVKGKVSPAAMNRSLRDITNDCSIEGLLQSHMVLDNHDTPRLRTVIGDLGQYRLARLLQFTLPGCPVIYYGAELGMEGGADPTNRGPMRWDLATDANEDLAYIQKLVQLRKDNPALRLGDFRVLDTQELVSFLRVTDQARETVIVIVNPTENEVHEIVPLRDSRLMDAAPIECLLTGERLVTHSGLVECRLGPRTARIYRTVDRGNAPGYSNFKRA